jgi:hypothetical protein
MKSTAKPEEGRWDPGDPHGLRLLRRALIWLGGIMFFWATARVFMLGSGYGAYYLAAGLLALAAVVVEPVVDRLRRRRREPF